MLSRYAQGIKICNLSTKPNARSQATFTHDEDVAYLIGGMLNERLSDIWSCEVKGLIYLILITIS